MTAGEIRARLAAGLVGPEQALQLVDSELAGGESASLWVLRGDLIQLTNSGEYSLANAQASYQRATELAPDQPEAYEELGHFYDAVEPDAARAMHYYQEALLRGAGERCRCALETLLRQKQGKRHLGRRTSG